LTLSFFSFSLLSGLLFLLCLAGGATAGTTFTVLSFDELASSGALGSIPPLAASFPDERGAVGPPVLLSISVVSAASVLEPVGSGVAILGSKIHVRCSVESSYSRVCLGIAEALPLGVALVASSRSDMHDLMEHGHSKRHRMVFLSHGQGADTDVGQTALYSTAPVGQDISQNSTPASSAGSPAALAAHDRVASLVLQVIHGVRVSALNVLVVVVSACTEPLLEAVTGPQFVGFLDDLVSTSNRAHDLFLLSRITVGV